MTSSAPLTIRLATAADEAAVRDLAALDSRAVPAGPVLLAEVAGELHAAASLADGAVVADPFRRTASTVAVLRARLASDGRNRAPRRSLLHPIRPVPVH